MSRIHEALKKAEQERALQQPGETVHPATVRASLSASALAAVDVLADTGVPQPAAPHASQFLRFDDLVGHCNKAQWQLDPNQNVFLDSAPASLGAEQFRTLRSRLYQLRASQTLRTVLVTSSISGEGKSFVANNLAHAIVRQPDRRALLIDADLRRPRLHFIFGASSAPGLTEYLREEADEYSIIQSGQQANLCFIPGGNEVTNPSELLSNNRLKALLDRVSPMFDWVILDSPPCVPVADASVLADICDGVLLVVRSGATPAQLAQKGVQQLRGKNILGVVLNAIDKVHMYDSYYYYEPYIYSGDVDGSKRA
ncbi:MAG TPA: CpsD/CapB family tyrosine-protein kinase [Candidatus Cybelea sp.]|nr:CpsD/CapB family tyrosine-protein kinase [Candidatus Cybelea sp.]